MKCGVEQNNSKLKGRRENKIEKDDLKEQAHYVQKGYYSAPVKWKDEVFCGTARFNNL